ncbi:TolC family protein [bacterium]|nr:TolC family protein [candidate division CSSED10-310 bacterium]
MMNDTLIRNRIHGIASICLLVAGSIMVMPPAVTRASDENTAATPGITNVKADPDVLHLDLPGSLLMAFQHNSSFQVDRLQPGITATYEQQARAEFDPAVTGTLLGIEYEGGEEDISGGDSLGVGATVTELLPSGTSLEIGVNRFPASSSIPVSERYDVTITQALLRGGGTSANLARLRQARLDTDISNYELKGIAESLAAETEKAYWNCILATQSITIYEKSLEIAERQQAETRERIRLGILSENESVAVEAELAGRLESLIDARSSLARNRLQLLRLINPGGPAPFTRTLDLTEPIRSSREENLDSVEAHVALGLKQRADLNQARLLANRGTLELVRTSNGILPKLDLFVRLGGSRYAESFNGLDGNEWAHEIEAGISFQYPFRNRSAAAADTRARLSSEQSAGALTNMLQLAEIDIRSAYIEVSRSRAQIEATEATRRLREETYQTELTKLRIGKSTSLLVAEASRNLVESEIACIGAAIAYRQALLELYRSEGSLLERRGIQF